MLELNWYEHSRDGDRKQKICYQVLTSSTQRQSMQVISSRRKQDDENDCEMYKNENARAKHPKLLSVIVKYANL